MNLFELFTILGTVFFTVSGQIVLKYGASTLYFPNAFNVKEVFNLIFNNLTNFYFLGAISAAFIASIFWSLAIQRVNLSIAYPFMSLSFISIFLASYFIFKEPISIFQILALVLIIGGVTLMGMK